MQERWHFYNIWSTEMLGTKLPVKQWRIYLVVCELGHPELPLDPRTLLHTNLAYSVEDHNVYMKWLWSMSVTLKMHFLTGFSTTHALYNDCNVDRMTTNSQWALVVATVNVLTRHLLLDHLVLLQPNHYWSNQPDLGVPIVQKFPNS